jgi:hypothetical protein
MLLEQVATFCFPLEIHPQILGLWLSNLQPAEWRLVT